MHSEWKKFPNRIKYTWYVVIEIAFPSFAKDKEPHCEKMYLHGFGLGP